MSFSLSALSANVGPILDRLIGTQVQAEHDAQDAAATKARAALASFNPTPKELTVARANVAKAREKADALRAQLKDAEHALGVAASAEASLAYQLSATHTQLRRAALAPYRTAAALAALDARLEQFEASDAWRRPGGHEYRMVLVHARQQLQMVSEGDADAPADLDAFLQRTFADAEAAQSAAIAERDAQRQAAAALERTRRVFGEPLTHSA